MANLSNINNKFIVQDNSRVLVNTTSDTGATLQVGGSFSTTNSVRVGNGVLYVGDGSNTTARIMGFGDYEMITGVSGATYLRVSGSSTLAGTLQGGQYILASGLAYGAVNNYTQIIDGSSGAITGTTATFSGDVTLTSTGAATFSIINTSASQTWGQYVGSNDDYIFRDFTDSRSTLALHGDGNATFVGVVTTDKIFVAKGQNLTHTTSSIKISQENSAKSQIRFYGADSSTPGTLEFMGTSSDGSTGGVRMLIDASGTIIGTGTYSAGNSIKIFEAERSGGAVKSDWSYNDATTDMSLGTNTNHAFNLKTNDTNRISIDNAGNVGMGISPTEKLDIFKDSGSTYIRVYDNSANSEVGLKLQGDAKTWTLQNWGSGGDNLRILNNAGDIVQLWDDNGNVMIGNANDPEKKLHVLGSTTDATPQVLIQNGSTGDASMTFNVSGQSYVMGIDYDDSKKFKIASSGNLGTNDRVTLLSSGNVGIGTITPLTQLQITSNTTTKLRVNTTGVADSMVEILGYDAGLHIGDNTNGNRWALWNDGPGTSTSLNFGSYALGTWYVPASQVMTMTSSGNVGIGITTPQTTLQVNGSASALNAHFGQGTNNSSGVFGGISLGYSEGGNASYRKVGIVAKAVGDGAARQDLHFLVDTVADSNSAGIADSKMHIQYNTGDVIINNNLGIGTASPSYNLEIGGTNNPKAAIVSNINSATSSLYFGDSDAKDRGQIVYTHFGDFMELKTGGNTRVYIESGINTAYTSDGLFNANATPSYWLHNNAKFSIGYMDNGSGLYSGAYAFQVKSTDGIPVTGREIGAIYINDQSNNRKPLRISNQGRININQTNTSTGLASTGWIDIQNGTSAYNIFNYYTGTDGSSGCARYRLDNTSPSFFDFYYSTTQVGYITTNGTDIFYANTSDYRLKEDLKDFDATSLLEQIQVYDFKWKESDNRMYGVVAHELQEVVPQAVVGEKDKEKFQAVDYSKLVPVLIKSIQELKAEIELLKNS